MSMMGWNYAGALIISYWSLVISHLLSTDNEILSRECFYSLLECQNLIALNYTYGQN